MYKRQECCALKWEDINYAERSVHVCRNAVKTTGDEIIVKAPKTTAGNRYVYFSAEMESLLREYEAFCASETERYDRREQTKDDYVFRRKGMKLPMTPSTFTWRFKKILKANDLPTDLNVHSLRHTAASLFIASGTDVGLSLIHIYFAVLYYFLAICIQSARRNRRSCPGNGRLELHWRAGIQYAGARRLHQNV